MFAEIKEKREVRNPGVSRERVPITQYTRRDGKYLGDPWDPLVGGR